MGDGRFAPRQGNKWSEKTVKTSDKSSKLLASVNRNIIKADGKDLAFITVHVTDKNGLVVPRSNNQIEFSIEGPG